jgi:hypothetical protein
MRSIFARAAITSLMLAGIAAAQSPTRNDTGQAGATPTHQLRTKQGSTFFGRLAEGGPDTVRFETSGGTLVLRRDMVAELRPIKPSEWRDGEYWFADPHTTRLFFAPTGRMLAAGEGYYSNTYLLLNSVNAGVTNRLSLGGSVTLIPDSRSQLAWFTPKVGLIANDNLNVAVGGLFGYVGFADEPGDRSFGVLYGVSTFGDVNASVTTGLGWGYVGGTLSGSPAAMVGGSVRVSKRAALITENYKFPSDDHALLGYGVRFFGEKLSVDLAFFNYTEEMIFPGLPFVSFAVKF